MKFTILATCLAAASTISAASVIPDYNNATALHEFEARSLFCSFNCELPRNWCMAGKSIESTFKGLVKVGGKVDPKAKYCRCQRIKDEKRCATKCGWKC